MEYTLNLVFNTSGGKKVSFSITDAKSTVTGAEVKAIMDNMIAKNIFQTSSGDLISKDSAALVAKTVSKLDIE